VNWSGRPGSNRRHPAWAFYFPGIHKSFKFRKEISAALATIGLFDAKEQQLYIHIL
jgi:hypothetical protein